MTAEMVQLLKGIARTISQNPIIYIKIMNIKNVFFPFMGTSFPFIICTNGLKKRTLMHATVQDKNKSYSLQKISFLVRIGG
jgi:hypothetical protein